MSDARKRDAAEEMDIPGHLCSCASPYPDGCHRFLFREGVGTGLGILSAFIAYITNSAVFPVALLLITSPVCCCHLSNFPCFDFNHSCLIDSRPCFIKLRDAASLINAPYVYIPCLASRLFLSSNYHPFSAETFLSLWPPICSRGCLPVSHRGGRQLQVEDL